MIDKLQVFSPIYVSKIFLNTTIFSKNKRDN